MSGRCEEKSKDPHEEGSNWGQLVLACVVHFSLSAVHPKDLNLLMSINKLIFVVLLLASVARSGAGRTGTKQT